MQHTGHFHRRKMPALRVPGAVHQIWVLVAQLPVGRLTNVIRKPGATGRHGSWNAPQVEAQLIGGCIVGVKTSAGGERVGQIVDHDVVEQGVNVVVGDYGIELFLYVCGKRNGTGENGTWKRGRGLRIKIILQQKSLQAYTQRVRFGSLNMEATTFHHHHMQLIAQRKHLIHILSVNKRGRPHADHQQFQHRQQCLGHAKITMISNHVLRIQRGQMRANDRAPITALYDESCVAQTQHEVTQDDRILCGAKTLACRAL